MSSFQLSDGRGLLQAAGPAEDGVLTALNQQGCREAVKVQQSYMQTHKHTDTHMHMYVCICTYHAFSNPNLHPSPPFPPPHTHHTPQCHYRYGQLYGVPREWVLCELLLKGVKEKQFEQAAQICQSVSVANSQLITLQIAMHH